jgi:hypothetical protein
MNDWLACNDKSEGGHCKRQLKAAFVNDFKRLYAEYLLLNPLFSG